MEQTIIMSLLEQAKGAGIFAGVVGLVVAYVFYRRWHSADTYIRELNKLNMDSNTENLKEYVALMATIKQKMLDLEQYFKTDNDEKPTKKNA